MEMITNKLSEDNKNNGIYIKTPIYMRNKFFNYYLSKNDVLTFDVEMDT